MDYDERRRAQNRIAQRKYRRRLQERKEQPDGTNANTNTTSTSTSTTNATSPEPVIQQRVSSGGLPESSGHWEFISSTPQIQPLLQLDPPEFHYSAPDLENSDFGTECFDSDPTVWGEQEHRAPCPSSSYPPTYIPGVDFMAQISPLQQYQALPTRLGQARRSHSTFLPSNSSNGFYSPTANLDSSDQPTADANNFVPKRAASVSWPSPISRRTSHHRQQSMSSEVMLDIGRDRDPQFARYNEGEWDSSNGKTLARLETEGVSADFRTSLSIDSPVNHSSRNGRRTRQSKATDTKDRCLEEANVKQREHIGRQAERLVASSVDLYDLSVQLGLCSRDQNFRRMLQDIKHRFIALLDLESDLSDLDLE